jgi:hypothetical protein
MGPAKGQTAKIVMAFCNSCGAALKPEAKCCSGCGSAVTSAAKAANSAPISFIRLTAPLLSAIMAIGIGGRRMGLCSTARLIWTERGPSRPAKDVYSGKL